MKRILHILVPILTVTISLLLSQIAGYFLSTLIWGYDGGFLQYIVALGFGLLIFALLFTLLNVLLPRRRENFNNTIISALEQISGGNFNVKIDYDGRYPFGDLIDKINKMAQDLGTIETLRSDFVSNVSHEIQSPLTSIMGYITLLENDKLPEELRKEYLSIIKSESERLSKLSKNLLKLSSLDAGLDALNKVNYRFDTQIQNTVILFEPELNAKNITVNADLNKTSITADESLLQQVLINIINNAIKFTLKNGIIGISLKQNGDKTMLKITDNGIGIAHDDIPHIFERFYKADKSRARAEGGNGLGLAIVKKIINLHGGTIEAESELGKGTAFTIII